MTQQKYARLNAGRDVVETFTPPDNFKLTDCFHPTIASQFVACPPEVEVCWTLDGTTWKPPIAAATQQQE